MNFKGFGDEAMPDVGGGGGGRPIPAGMYDSLVRQTSIYSMTLDELQNTIGGGAGKDFGSMNMDELMKNIWPAEETQTMMGGAMLGTSSTTGSTQGGGGAGVPGGSAYLQRQGSLTLPRTLSKKTVDEVWQDMSKENDGVGTTGSIASLAASLQQRQRTLGEMTLEEFLVKAGVVREDMQLAGKPNNVGFIGELSLSNNNVLGLPFQEAGLSLGLMGNRQIQDTTNQISLQSPNLPLNFNGVSTTTQEQLPQMHAQQRQQVPAAAAAQQMQQQLFPKQGGISPYTTPMPQLGSPKIQGGLVGFSDQGFRGIGLSGSRAAGAVTIATNGSPALSSDGIVGKGHHNGYASSNSPVPYVFSGVRGRKSGTIEKVVERRHRRMVKNRESAARSRARKQAYTEELENKVTKLKKGNEALREKQEELMEAQNNQAIELMNMQQGRKKRCLRKTMTGPW